jgi:hypothetical protein
LNLNKVIVKVKFVSSWLCLLRNYIFLDSLLLMKVDIHIL